VLCRSRLMDYVTPYAELHTKVPTVTTAVNTTIYLYYDSGQPDNSTWVGVTGSAVSQNVWDSNFVFVSHMNDGADTSHIAVSTSVNTHAAKKGAAEPALATGGVGKGQDFDGTDDVVNVDDSASYRVWAVDS